MPGSQATPTENLMRFLGEASLTGSNGLYDSTAS